MDGEDCEALLWNVIRDSHPTFSSKVNDGKELLDNAMEACARQPEGESREITVTIRRINLFLIIRITNSSVAAPTIIDGSLVTSKRDKRLHGWGLRSVKAAAGIFYQ